MVFTEVVDIRCRRFLNIFIYVAEPRIEAVSYFDDEGIKTMPERCESA